MITHYNKLLVVTILLGVTKGLRQVYMHRVLTESVPNDQLSAVGVLQMTLNAIGFILFGSILGFIDILFILIFTFQNHMVKNYPLNDFLTKQFFLFLQELLDISLIIIHGVLFF